MIDDIKPLALSIAEIFSNDKHICYDIPMYQREYIWGQKEWGLLFDDIVSNPKGYFLGAIICVNLKQISTFQGDRLQVIDGQQRVTSLSLFMIALYEILNDYRDVIKNESILTNLKARLVLFNDTDDIPLARLTPQIHNYNQDDYFALLNEKNLRYSDIKVKNAGNRRIYRAYKFFCSAIQQYMKEKILEADDLENDNMRVIEFNILKELLDKVYSAVVVSIEVSTNKDAYMFFESLNNRGIPLSAIDLIKNLLISVAENPNDKYSTKRCNDQWERICSYLGDEYTTQERFFRQYYNAYREKLNIPYIKEDSKTKYPLGYLATKSTMLDIYEKLIKDNYQLFLDSIEREAKIYSIIINNAKPEDVVDKYEDALINLERIQGAPSYLLLLYILSNKELLNLSEDGVVIIIKYLTKFFVRRNITDFPNTRNLNKIFMDIVESIKDLKGNDVVNRVLSILKDNSSSDTVFEEKLYGPIYDDNVDSTRFLLCYYEDKFKTNEIHTNLWSRDKNNKYIWTIEHIFPEGKNIPQSWIDMIANGDKVLAKKYLEEYVHTLGNLTITGYNQNLSNMSFEQKLNLQKDGKYIGYKNGLKLNEDVVNQNLWSIENIKKRTEKLVGEFLLEFKL